MPTVPRYSAQVTPGISQARQNISASPAAFGGQEARALGQVGQGLNALAQRSEEIQAENDELQAREAYVAASDALRDRMRGEGGYLTLQGRNAYEGYDDFAEEIERLPNEYLGGMSDRARERFLEMWAARRESALNQGASHAAGQRRAYAEQIFEAERAEATLAAIEDRGDAGAFSARLSQGERAIRDRGAAMGMDGEVVDLLVDEWRSATILSSINAALDSGDTTGARAMYERSEGLMMPGERENAQEVLRTADVTVRAQEGVDALWARFGTDAAAARREIRQNYEGELEDQMIRRYDARLAESTVSAADRQDRAFDEAAALFEENPYLLVSDLPAHLQNALTAGQRAILDSMRRNIPDADQREYLNEIARQAQEDPDALRSRQPENFTRHLTGERLDQARRMWRAAWENSGAADDEIDLIRTEQTIMNTGLESLGVERDDIEGRRAFYDSVEAARRAFADEHSREPNRQELQDIVDAATADVLINRRFGLFDVTGNVPLDRAGLRGDYRAVESAFPSGMSEERRDELYGRALAGFNARGVTPTPGQLASVIRSLSEGQ